MTNNKQITDTWERALRAYAYPVDLAKYEAAEDFPGWFEDNLSKGYRSETIAFEDKFRREAKTHIEAWYEVIFWKLYSSGMSRNRITSGVVDKVVDASARGLIKCLRDEGVSPETVRQFTEFLGYNENEDFEKIITITTERLWDKCWLYIENPNLESFQQFRDILFKTDAIATAATFPAFLKPDDFPMVDRQVARWARQNGAEHTFESCGGPSLVTYAGLGESPLKDRDWAFVQSWVEWCRFAAHRLNDLTTRHWRARDVEMAVFTAQRNKMRLEPLYG